MKLDNMPDFVRNSSTIYKWTGKCADGVIRTYIRTETSKGFRWKTICVNQNQNRKESKASKILKMLDELLNNM